MRNGNRLFLVRNTKHVSLVPHSVLGAYRTLYLNDRGEWVNMNMAHLFTHEEVNKLKQSDDMLVVDWVDEAQVYY